jgi:hypothetical protein
MFFLVISVWTIILIKHLSIIFYSTWISIIVSIKHTYNHISSNYKCFLLYKKNSNHNYKSYLNANQSLKQLTRKKIIYKKVFEISSHQKRLANISTTLKVKLKDEKVWNGREISANNSSTNTSICKIPQNLVLTKS